MRTYKLTFNDSLVEGVRHSFPTQNAITLWMQQQIERMLRQIAIDKDAETKPLRKISVSERIKALSAVPASSSTADYKEDVTEIMSEKY